ncbi:hypothetical protein ABPG74_002812 [Tetrahymena malaccensis]
MEEVNLSYKEVVEKIKSKKINNILFLTGAGISTSSGIPDFRSPNGLYSRLQKYNLEYPEQIFEINYFKKNQMPFYEMDKEFFSNKPHFTSAHYFMAEVYRREQLLYVFSQNVDGLELEAGLPLQKLCQVHGNYRGAKCSKCGFKHDIIKYKEFVQQQVIYKCESCKRGAVRPNVVFFGERLDKEFAKNTYKIAAADCVFIMGTSMQVAPFNLTVDKISKNVPVIVVNRDMVYLPENKYIHLKNDIDDNIEKLMTDLGWDFPKIERNYPPKWFSGSSTSEKNEESDEEEEKQDKEKIYENQEELKNIEQKFEDLNF